MSLSKKSLPMMAQRLYRRFYFDSYDCLLDSRTPVSERSYRTKVKTYDQYRRRRGYFEFIRSLHVDDLECDWVTFGHELTKLLDLFPLITEITIGDEIREFEDYPFRLNVPPRSLDGKRPARTQATLKNAVYLDGRSTGWPNLTGITPKLRDYDCKVVCSIFISSDCGVDWKMSRWDDHQHTQVVLPLLSHLPPWLFYRKQTGLTLGGKRIEEDPPFCKICDRDIEFMSIQKIITLNSLSRHLEERRKDGLKEIQRWVVRPSSLAHVPQFLLQNPHISHLTLNKVRFHLFLALDWFPSQQVNPTPYTLRYLRFSIDFSAACQADTESRLKDILEPLETASFLFPKLKEFRIDVEPVKVGAEAIEAIPSIGLIARFLVHLGGLDFSMTIADCRDCPPNVQLRNILHDQLVKQVKLRQEKVRGAMKQRSKSKYMK
jgi:hypothetical protein